MCSFVIEQKFAKNSNDKEIDILIPKDFCVVLSFLAIKAVVEGCVIVVVLSHLK
jgi:hypothetical protein